MTERDDDLFTPTLQDAPSRAYADRPWRLSSQFWVAFFGGPLASAVIGYLNGSRLGIPERNKQLIVVAGVVGLALAIAFGFALEALEVGSAARLANQAAGVVAYGAIFKLQRSGERVYEFYAEGDAEYDSLWGPGLAAVIGLGLPSALLVGGLTTGLAG